MSAALKQRVFVDSATQDLWRVAETDDVDELERIIRRVGDVNARNEHGMTALMRASYHGHQQMVRALLEHGADPNVMRNDRFTALALAAFFGHTETVRILIEHGAKTEVVTRCGASAYMWATARTFGEAARCLESHTPPAPTPIRSPAPASVRTAPAPVSPAPVSPVPVPIKTLKDPPEIWDLVHEVPRGFNARSAFFARLGSMSRGVAVGVLTGLLLIVACGVGVFMWRGSKAGSVQVDVQSKQTSPEVIPAPPPRVEVPVSEVPATAEQTNAVNDPPRRVAPRPFKPRSSDTPIVVQDLPKPSEPPAVTTPQFEKPKVAEPATRTKPNEGLSPQLITPAQSSKPKAKVIQWP